MGEDVEAAIGEEEEGDGGDGSVGQRVEGTGTWKGLEEVAEIV